MGPHAADRAAVGRNQVLPSYEDELEPDNSVVRESSPRWLLHRALFWINSLYSRIAGTTNTSISSDSDSRDTTTPQKARPLSAAVDRLTRTPYDIKKIAVIGVHGWFPGKLLQRVVGEPIGTSSHFARKMVLATQHFFHDRYNISLPQDAFSIIAIEGEGKVEARVDRLFTQISSKWADTLRSADLVLVASHSQGTPVATMLVARLMDAGLVDPSRQRAGILAMAGVNHGPYPQHKSSLIVKYVESDPARQLFEFNEPTSMISTMFYNALHRILTAGVAFTAVGSWYDQVVPIYSACLHGIHHPNIFRALYIDQADYQPDFLSHLVVFGLKLRNAGLSDYGLIVHLSDLLQGNIYGFGTQGHYALYEEENTYKLGVAWAMGSRRTWIQQPSLIQSSTHKTNPYHLPWIMAKLTLDPVIAANPKLAADLMDLIRLFDAWEVGSSAKLKDVKYRLEPMKSKL
eukprot:jgi/Hompol1/334/HPOL_005282-RA